MNCGGELYAETSRSCSPSLFLDPQAASVLRKESSVHPLFVVAIPLLLIGVGMILNSIGLSFDQPQSSPEQDPTKRLNIERESFRNFFDRQRSRALKRQKRVRSVRLATDDCDDRFFHLALRRYCA